LYPHAQQANSGQQWTTGSRISRQILQHCPMQLRQVAAPHAMGSGTHHGFF
jgi:hypothetical protein